VLICAALRQVRVSKLYRSVSTHIAHFI